MKFPTTIKDIALALQLSPSTVSRALRGEYDISESTRLRVRAYAEKINYQPNPIAVNLKAGRSLSIGVVVCEVANNFFSQAIDGVESVAATKGYTVIVTQSHGSAKREDINIEQLASRSIDGLLVSITPETTDLSKLKELNAKGLPIVFFDRVTDEIKTHKVVSNNTKGAFDATSYLIKAGCKHIAHVTCSPNLALTRERLAGYKDALMKSGFPYREEYVQYCVRSGASKEEMEAAVENLIRLNPRPDGLFIGSDRLTTGFLVTLKNHPARLHRDMLLAGFTNSNLAGLFVPPLVPVRQKAYEMGQQATQLLIQLIESKTVVAEFEHHVLDTELITG